MAENSKIEWTDATWNPTVGCSVISAGCTNCYAMKMAGRLEAMGSPIYQGHTIKTKAGFVWNGKVAASNWGQMIKPLSWKKPRRIFVNSMSDLFHEDMPAQVIDQVFAVMALCPQHTFQVLTKRHARMRDYFASRITPDQINAAMNEIAPAAWHNRELDDYGGLPLPNVWLGVSVEDQHAADYRIPALLETPAAVRFLSCEPLLSEIDLTGDERRTPKGWLGYRCTRCRKLQARCACIFQSNSVPPSANYRGIDWVIAGSESGPHARPCNLDWVRGIRDQCVEANVPLFWKQHVVNGKKVSLPELDGQEWRQFPEPQQ